MPPSQKRELKGMREVSEKMVEGGQKDKKGAEIESDIFFSS